MKKFIEFLFEIFFGKKIREIVREELEDLIGDGEEPIDPPIDPPIDEIDVEKYKYYYKGKLSGALYFLEEGDNLRCKLNKWDGNPIRYNNMVKYLGNVTERYSEKTGQKEWVVTLNELGWEKENAEKLNEKILAKRIEDTRVDAGENSHEAMRFVEFNGRMGIIFVNEEILKYRSNFGDKLELN